jgi:hypothetical protein
MKIMMMTTFSSSLILFFWLFLSASTVNGTMSFLEKLPNGMAIGKILGHRTNKSDDTTLSPFGIAFMNANFDWSIKFCQQEFPLKPGISNGQALGDPCCQWKPGNTPQVTVTTVTFPSTSSCSSSKTYVLMNSSPSILPSINTPSSAFRAATIHPPKFEPSSTTLPSTTSLKNRDPKTVLISGGAHRQCP